MFAAANLEAGTTFTVCHGVDCKSTTLSVSSTRVGPDRQGAYVTPVLCMDAVPSCVGHVDPSTADVFLYAEVGEVGRGTRLSLTVAKPDGTVLAAHDGVVEYYSDEPNGPGCEPTCTAAQF